MKCPKCNFEYEDSFKFCPECGEAKPLKASLTTGAPTEPSPTRSDLNASGTESSSLVSPPSPEGTQKYSTMLEHGEKEQEKPSRFNRKTKIVVGVVCVLCVFGLAIGLVVGLSGGGTKETHETATNTTTVIPQESAQGKELQVKTVGFSKWQYANSYNIGGIIVNPNKSLGAWQTTLTVTAYGANNVVLGSRQESIYTIPPGQEMGFSSFANGDAGAVTRVEVVPRVARWEKMSSLPFFTFENTAYLPGTSNKITGIIGSSLSKTYTQVKVTAVLLDQAGNAQGAGFAYVDNVPAGQKVPFEVSLETAVTPATVSFFGDVTSLSQESP